MKRLVVAVLGLWATGVWGVDLQDVFLDPPRTAYPETWFHFINGNVSRAGIAADLDAIAAAGISGVQFFHGGGIGTEPWPGTDEQIPCLSSKWDELVAFLADACHERGLTFKMQNCPGWSMSGGPWITPDKAMRELRWIVSRVTDGCLKPPVVPEQKDVEGGFSDWHDIVTVAFPTPSGARASCAAREVTNLVWEAVSPEPFIVRTLVLSSVRAMNHHRCYDPEVVVTLAAETEAGWQSVRSWPMPQSNWQDNEDLSLAVPETTARRFRVTFVAQHACEVKHVNLLSRAVPHAWESEAGLCLRSLMDDPEVANDAGAYVDPKTLVRVPAEGLKRAGDWTILRIGHVNKCLRNGPAPAEATGWECDKLSPRGIEANFAGYVGRLTRKGGPLAGKLDGMLLDSWECKSQNWTWGMDATFRAARGYALDAWWPALCGYVVGSREATRLFYRDWRTLLSDLLEKNYFGRMSELAHANGFTVAFETACGDTFPGDLLAYWRDADEPMCEFWRCSEGDGPWGGWLERDAYKPLRPCVSAARLYGKRRVSAESLTGGLSWREDLSDFKPYLDRAFATGVTHPVFHTYTHNPVVGGLPPGSSFGAWAIGSPFLRGQTWWPLMPELTRYIARCSALLEAGRPVSDVLVYLGDRQDHKPLGRPAALPAGYEYDYLNPDGLQRLVGVRDGRIVTTNGLSYAMLLVLDDKMPRPATTARLAALKAEGAQIGGVPAVPPDVEALSGDVRWQHRTDGTCHWYFLDPQLARAVVRLREAKERVEIWNPRTGETSSVDAGAITLDEPVFVVCRPGVARPVPLAGTFAVQDLTDGRPWTLAFLSDGRTCMLNELVAWKDLPGTAEEKAYAGRVRYTTTFDWSGGIAPVLEIPNLAGVAEVCVNGRRVGASWARPYTLPMGDALRVGANTLEVVVTSPWHNRLVYDAGQPESRRKTWTHGGPKKDTPLIPSGLRGKVLLTYR